MANHKRDLCLCGGIKLMESKQCKNCNSSIMRKQVKGIIGQFCVTCRIDKPLEEFSSRPNGRRYTCKTCISHDPQLLKKKRRKDSWLQFQYGLTLLEFNKLHTKQKGRCLGCFTLLPLTGPNTCVDHNHLTGKIRGLLCRTCNMGLGSLQDDSQILRNLLDYLEKNDS